MNILFVKIGRGNKVGKDNLKRYWHGRQANSVQFDSGHKLWENIPFDPSISGKNSLWTKNLIIAIAIALTIITISYLSYASKRPLSLTKYKVDIGWYFSVFPKRIGFQFIIFLPLFPLFCSFPNPNFEFCQTVWLFFYFTLDEEKNI